MMRLFSSIYLALLALLTGMGNAQSASCSSTLTASYAAPSVADGYVARLVANGLSTPRGLKFDRQGALLVVEQNSGVVALNITDAGQGCLSASKPKTVVNDTTLTHGIELSPDGNTLYASSSDVVSSWGYSSQDQATTSSASIVIENMNGTDHVTRTLLFSRKVPDLMVVTRGSSSNLDYVAQDVTAGHSEVKAFNLTNATQPYNFDTDGLLLGWGLRNDVGVDEEPVTGAIYTVENSADQITRNNVDIHNTNPAEEMNFLGYLNGTQSSNQGRNFGYPTCFTAWDPSIIPDFNGPVGSQFAIDNPNTTINDTDCSLAAVQSARLSFQAHMAPIDILFNTAGTAAWITFHGSWDASPPVGYKLSVVEFANGEPVAPNTSTTAAVDIMTNANIKNCPNGCFRPAGLAWDAQGRLFMSSDATGEIYAILRADGTNTSSVGSNATGTVPAATATTSAAKSGDASSLINPTTQAYMGAFALAVGVLAFLV